MKKILFMQIFFISIMPHSAYLKADTFATSDSGERVILKSDGTWEKFEEVQRSELNDLNYKDDTVKITFDQISVVGRKKYSVGIKTEMQLSVEVVTQTKIVNPKTHRIWGFENGSNVGGSSPSGFYLKDNYGNDMKILSVSPSYVGHKERGLRYGQVRVFKIIANDYPLESAKYLNLKINKYVLGNKQPVIFKIPVDQINKI